MVEAPGQSIQCVQSLNSKVDYKGLRKNLKIETVQVANNKLGK